MAKKGTLPENNEVVIDKDLLRKAKLAADVERTRSSARCSICSAEAAPNSTESLCWVCRRLKISAWRDSDQQISVQE